MKTPLIYLDYAAATPLDKRAETAMRPFLAEHFHNPSAAYRAGRCARQQLEQARASVARQLGAKPAEIIFTAGATEANNLAIQGVMRHFPDAELLVSAIEHESVLEPAKLHNVKHVPVNKQGVVGLDKLESMITDSTVLVSVMMVNNELGTLQPLKEISSLLQKIRKQRSKQFNKKPLYLHTDAAQAANYFDLNTARLGVDLLSLNGGKIYGPKQTGGLFVRANVILEPLILGGGQELNRRSGTENVAGFIGLAKALAITSSQRKTESLRLGRLRRLFISEVTKKPTAIIVNGSLKHSAPHIVHLTIQGSDNERLMMELDEQGVQCAVGSACSAASTEPSHVLKAIGLDDHLARSSLRFSMGRSTNQADIRHVVRLLQSKGGLP